MKIQYQILELDTQHLKKTDRWSDDSKRDRICFVPANLGGWNNNIQDTFEEAVEVLKMNGNDYTEYTIVPRIYITDY